MAFSNKVSTKMSQHFDTNLYNLLVKANIFGDKCITLQYREITTIR